MTDMELLYAATERCACGAGLAYPLDNELAFKMRAWTCSAYLKGMAGNGPHDQLDFRFFKVREETSINNRGHHTTRPPGTVCRSVGMATCPQCQHKWESEPYDANGLGHHWFSGPCPNCGYAVGGAGIHRSDDGPSIEQRYLEVVLVTAPDSEVAS